MSHYAMLLLVSGIAPLVLSFWPALKFYRHKLSLVFSIGLVTLIFGAWDVFAVSRGHWHFNPQAVWPARILNLPVEEVLFFVVIPFCCIFTWEALLFIKERRQ